MHCIAHAQIAKLVVNVFGENVSTLLDSPAQSVDLNPIKYAWVPGEKLLVIFTKIYTGKKDIIHNFSKYGGLFQSDN